MRIFINTPFWSFSGITIVYGARGFFKIIIGIFNINKDDSANPSPSLVPTTPETAAVQQNIAQKKSELQAVVDFLATFPLYAGFLCILQFS